MFILGCFLKLTEVRFTKLENKIHLKSYKFYRLCTQYTGYLSVPTRQTIRYSMNSNDTELEQVVHTHRTCGQHLFPSAKLTFSSQWLSQDISMFLHEISLSLEISVHKSLSLFSS